MQGSPKGSREHEETYKPAVAIRILPRLLMDSTLQQADQVSIDCKEIQSNQLAKDDNTLYRLKTDMRLLRGWLDT